MHEAELESSHERLWKAQEVKEVQITLDQVCVKARAFEKKSIHEYRVVLGLLGFLIALSLVYLVRFSEPLIRIGNASVLSIFLYMLVRAMQKGPPRKLRVGAQSDTCVNFLRKELQKKRETLLEFRWIWWLLLPGLFAAWWGGGPVAISKWLGISRPWLTSYQESPAPLVGFVVLVAVMWFGSGREARGIQREIEELGREPRRS